VKEEPKRYTRVMYVTTYVKMQNNERKMGETSRERLDEG
jgi:hypothetical protein